MPDPSVSTGAPPADAIVLGFDVGSRRIGVAVGSAPGGARAVAVVDVHAAGPDWKALDRLHGEWRPRGLMVGDPLTLDGGDQPIRRRARAFAHELKARYRLPVVMVDERSSSIEAAQRFARERAAGNRRRRDAEALDAAAAAVIIERWLSAPDNATPL
ncbi:Holliday junction resolvase RuvX [Pseudoxanthomonas sp. NC8]|nr:Holliday junction resolvase RuvX [Pseudoxanthomonas sp. NC8]